MPFYHHVWSATLWYDELGVVDHSAEARANLIDQYQSLPRMQGALDSVMALCGELETVIFEVLTGRAIPTAVGAQLDTLGRIVGQRRGELTDTAYRIMLLGRIFVNRANGTIPEILELFDILGVESTGIHEMYPAALHVDAAGMVYPEQVGILLFDMKPAGVRYDWLYSTSAVGAIFRTSSTLGVDEVTTTEGTDDFGGGIGGIFSHTRWTA